jgi:type II pantothenate kinase
VGLTGCGASALAARLTLDTARVDEFTAWRMGAELLRGSLGSAAYLLVSVGTGTSALLVRGASVQRVGGTALGGGTLAGLGLALVGTGSFDELAALAGRGDRRRVDLLLSDIYDAEESPLPGAMTAAAFARLARRPSPAPEPADLAHAIVGLVGENVGLICAGLAQAAGVDEIVFGGSALRGNPALANLLKGVCLACGRRPVLLENGEFAGALGALNVAAQGGP